MRYAIFSDIHGNLPAFEAILEDMNGQDVQKHFCLGDIVGYGAYPDECVSLVRALGCHTVAGNHDYAVLGKISTRHFNKMAKKSTLWTRDTLRAESLEFLDSLTLVEKFGDVSLVHGSLHSPELFDYIQNSYDAYLSLTRTPGRLCFVGHSHIPVAFVQDPFITYSLDQTIEVPEEGKVLVNVGSVGQPRDKNPYACYAIYDDQDGKVTIRRQPYDVEKAIEAIQDRGLPTVLGERLRYGR